MLQLEEFIKFVQNRCSDRFYGEVYKFSVTHLEVVLYDSLVYFKKFNGLNTSYWRILLQLQKTVYTRV